MFWEIACTMLSRFVATMLYPVYLRAKLYRASLDKPTSAVKYASGLVSRTQSKILYPFSS
jgi:hypothetical protein